MGKIYSAEDLALFARFVEARRQHQPDACAGGSSCWVLHGPPALETQHGLKLRCRNCRSIVTAKIPLRQNSVRYGSGFTR